MKRRDLVVPLGNATAWPLAANAQPSDDMRLVGALVPRMIQAGSFVSQYFGGDYRKAGWVDGHSVRIETRWAAGDAAKTRNYATELVAFRDPSILHTILLD